MFGTEKQKTGYPSIDKPWLKFYDKALNEVKSKFVCKFIFQLCGFIYATFIFKRFD